MSVSASSHVAHRTPHPPGARPARYVCIPHTLTRAAHEHPRAIGVYALIARQFLVTGDAIPISPADLTRFDPTLSRGSALRALDWLLDRGYLHTTSAPSGQKRQVLPTWGRIRGEARCWTRAEYRWGRPAHVHISTLDIRLLDILIGRFHPNAEQRAARVSRYLTAPLLTLADVGTYALALTGVPVADAPRLVAAGLLQGDNQQCYAHPLPDDATLLASLSQPTPSRQDATLTEHGYAALGIPLRATPAGQPLFFVDPNRSAHLIDHLIANLITDAPSVSTPDTAAVCDTCPSADPAQSIPWEKKEKQGKSTPSSQIGGSSQTISIPDTESARRLQEYQVIPAYVARFGMVPLDVIEHMIKCAEYGPQVRNKPGYVVWALGEYVAHGYLPTVPSSPDRIDWAALARHYTAGETDTAGDVTPSAQPGAPADVVGTVSVDAEPSDAGQDAAPSEGPQDSDHPDVMTPVSIEETPSEGPQDSDHPDVMTPVLTDAERSSERRDDITELLPFAADDRSAPVPAHWHDALAAYVPRTAVPILQRLIYQVSAQGAHLQARDRADQTAALLHLPALQACCVAAGLLRPTRCTLVDGSPPVAPADVPLPAPPDWIDAARWAGLSPLLRQALVGATLVDGQVVPARPGADRVLARATAQVAALVAALPAPVGADPQGGR